MVVGLPYSVGVPYTVDDEYAWSVRARTVLLCGWPSGLGDGRRERG